jgi:large subunit ribosomal protein L53
MKTTYLTQLSCAFNPFSRTAIVPRLFLGMLPANAHKTIQIKTTQLPRNATQPAFLELGFKDGKKMKYEWKEMTHEEFQNAEQKPATIHDVVAEVDRHARITGRKEELAG